VTRQGSTSPADGPQTLVEDATAHRVPPGLAAAVVTPTGAAHLLTSGLADVRSRRPVTVHTTFLWFSMTKIVTATAAMMLADRGALDLDAPVIEHVPEMRVLHGPVSLITARHLLAHSSGLANPPPICWVRQQMRRRPIAGRSSPGCCTGAGGFGSAQETLPPLLTTAGSSPGIAANRARAPFIELVLSCVAPGYGSWVAVRHRISAGRSAGFPAGVRGRVNVLTGLLSRR
jgi:beta-lactamase family protein